ncbi:plasmid replication, integration and excision activator [Allorhizocola rhizosphaerae]|uniref:plasmid replication, integration and excision activator n=1 Tax=Allorhizocola rhizosphaerae TaxID=1872709 RepID=UPI000E3BA777|nr:plasmid replication, integration and excision activator [Allorhizocola rhizosphaerae]
MAIKGPIPIRFEQVFPHGAYLNSEVTPVWQYDGNGNRLGQAIHPDTGELMWQVTVIDADPAVKAASKAVAVKLAARHQPVPPAAPEGSPFTPVEFTDMAVTPYLADGFGGSKRLAWSIQARDMVPVSASQVAAAA